MLGKEKRTTLALTGALDTTVVANPLSVKDLALLEVSGSAEGLGASGLRDTAFVPKASHGGGQGRENGDNAGSVHFGGC